MEELWWCIEEKQPTCEKSLYLVTGGVFGNKEPTLVRFNNYKQYWTNAKNSWQTMNHDDFSMVGTKWVQVMLPKVPSELHTK